MAKIIRGPVTNAWLARQIAGINRDTAAMVRSFTEGMWNPDFCSANADHKAISILSDLRQRLDWIEKHIGTPEDSTRG